jgi:hypothetical protein
MLAQAWALQFGFMDGGMPGASYQDGKKMAMTLVGSKPLDSSSSSLASSKPPSPTQFLASRFTEITEELWKAGGKDKAATVSQTQSSNAFTMPLNLLPVSSSHAMSLALSTLQMTHHEEGTPHIPFFCPPFLSLLLSGISSSTLTLLYTQMNRVQSSTPSRFSHPPKTIACAKMQNKLLRTVPLNDKEKSSFKCRKYTYPHDLNLLPSVLHPHCAAKQHLHLWNPATLRSIPSALTMDDITRIQDVMCHAWAESTHKTYSSGLLVFHVYCDSCSIPEEDCTPAVLHDLGIMHGHDY